jgi:dephospho-CoA kinase
MPLTCPTCDAFAFTGHGPSNPSLDLRCTACGAQTPANTLPLFLISGASGTGKSTLVPHLRTRLPDCLVVGADLLVDLTHRDRAAFLQRWIRIAYATAQCGRPLVLAGVIESEEIERHGERGLLTGPVYLVGLDCGEDVRRERLRRRPRWANLAPEKLEARIGEHEEMAGRVRATADVVFDSGREGVEELAVKVAAWVRERFALTQPSMAPAG